MSLSSELIAKFVKATRDDEKKKNETVAYGTVVKQNNTTYVKLDGSELLTPVFSTAGAQNGERVTVLIKNHSAIVTGNLDSPSATSGDVNTLSVNKLDANQASITYATISQLNATNANVGSLSADHASFKNATANNFQAVNAKIDNLDVENLDAVYANIDFSNIGKAAMEYFYSQSGLIKDVVVGDATITGKLAGVTLSGDLIEGNTVKAEKLVIKGSDGLYYKLNTDGMKVEAQQTDENSINGSVIKAKSITATKISVKDLVAFDATIGGFNITDSALYSGVKESVGNTTRGIYLDKDGQMAIGDSNNYIKYFKDTDGTYKLAISAKSISISGGADVETAINDIKNSVDGIEIGGRNLVLNSEDEVSFKNTVQTFPLSVYGIQNIKNRQVTVSFDAATDEAGTGIDFYLRTAVVNGTGQNASNIIPVSNLTTKYVRYSGVTTATDLDAVTLAIRSTTAATGSIHSSTATIYVRNIKVEFGNKSTDWTAAPEDLDIGSRNYALNSDTLQRITTSYYKTYEVSPEVINLQNSRAVVSFDAKKLAGSSSVNIYAYLRGSDGVVVQSEKIGDITEEYARYSCYIACPADLSAATHIAINTNVNTGDVYIKNVKLERGTKASDWTPAPEDVDADISNASKTATNFISYDSSSGLQLGNKTSGSWSGFRTQITSSAFNILNSAGATLASYGAKLIELGKNATDAVIKLCGGKGQIEYTFDSDTGLNYLQMSADKLRLKSSELSSLYCLYTDNSTRWEKSATNVYPDAVNMYASKCIDPTMVEKVEGWRTSGMDIKPTYIDAYSPGDILIRSERNLTICDAHGSTRTVQEGTSGIWTYRKYSNGDVELWGSYAISNMDCTTAMGSMYRTAVFSPSAFPFTVYNPNLTASYESTGYGAMLWATTATTNTTPPNYYLVRPTSTTIASGKINFHVLGKWKN